MRLGLLTTHPIQYQAPWFRALAKEADLKVFFAHRPDAAQQGEGFGQTFQWDIDLLSGYPHQFLMNVATNPSPNRFFGCDTPEIAEVIRSEEGRTRDGEAVAPLSATGGEGQGEVASASSVSYLSPFFFLPSPIRFDAFIVCGWHVKSYWQAVRACRRAGVPVFVRGDSQLATPRSLLKRCLKRFLYRFLLRQFDGFLSVGQRNREYLVHYGVPENRIFFVPHFVDNEWFTEKAEKLKRGKAEIRKRWGIPADAFVVLFVGKFIPKKRPMDLVEAARLLQARSADSGLRNLPPSPRGEGRGEGQFSSAQPLHLLFVGSGELGPQLRQRCHVVFDAQAGRGVPQGGHPRPSDGRGIKGEGNLSQGPVVQSPVVGGLGLAPLPPASFPGFLNQTELPAAYAAADVLVLPSDGGETWGLVVNEAMACGLPAIVSDAVGCAPDLVDDGQTGFTFPLRDTKALADRLLRLQAMLGAGQDFRPALRAKLERYNLQTAVAATLSAISEIGKTAK